MEVATALVPLFTEAATRSADAAGAVVPADEPSQQGRPGATTVSRITRYSVSATQHREPLVT